MGCKSEVEDGRTSPLLVGVAQADRDLRVFHQGCLVANNNVASYVNNDSR